MKNPCLVFLSSLCSLCLCGEVFAGVDAEVKRPYELNVVLHVESNRALTDVFRDRVQRELQDWLREGLGDLARVTVSTEHPRLKEVVDRGLESLGGWRGRSSAKTHFVLLRFVGGWYEVQARQHDGLTGLVSPVRLARTRARDVVSKTAAELVERDFGVVGTFAGLPDADDRVQVELKGGELGVPMAEWVKEREVFALAPVQSDGSPGPRVPWALLRVVKPPEEGSAVCTCQLFARHPNPLAASGVHRCLKLGTTRGPLRLRVAVAGPNNTTRALDKDLGIEVRAEGFGHKPSADEAPKVTGHAFASQGGAFDTLKAGDAGQFDHVAFVKIAADPPARVPVEIVDDEPIEVKVAPERDGKNKDLLLKLDREEWSQAVADTYLIQVNLFQELKDLAPKPEQRAAAIKRARGGLDRFKKAHAELKEEGRKLAGKQLSDGKRLDLERDLKRLERIKEGEAELENFLKRLEDIDQKVNDPRLKHWDTQIVQAGLAEQDGDVDKALELYQGLADDAYDPAGLSQSGLGDKAALRNKLITLKKEWATKDDKHAQARLFVKEVWRGLRADDLKARMEEVRKHVAVLKAAGDVVTLSKFAQGLTEHGQRLDAENRKLKPELKVADEAQAKVIEEVSEALFKLGEEVNLFLKEKSKK
jgi:hypothetical protein